MFKTRVEKIGKDTKSSPLKTFCLIDIEVNEKFEECGSWLVKLQREENQLLEREDHLDRLFPKE